jgi:uncharacterized membrane-anchored protein YjiN (DUF445 family)
MKAKLERLKEEVKKSDKIKEEEKEQALSKIHEWYLEDQAEAKGVISKELLKISSEIAPILEEIGLM